MVSSVKETVQSSCLVVDDDIFSQAIFRKQLHELGIENITVAGDGQAAVLALGAMGHSPDYLICDIFMPDMDGIEFVGELSRSNYAGGLILVTGGDHVMLEVATDIAVLSGLKVLGSFRKPIPLHALRKAIATDLAPD